MSKREDIVAQTLGRIPTLTLELFTEASLTNSFDDYRTLRDTAPVVRLARPDVCAIGRFGDVQTALRTPDVLISGEGVGFSTPFNAPKGLNVIQSDGERHRRLRSVVTRPLAPINLKPAREALKRMIAERIVTLKGSGPFDAMTQLACFLPVEAVSHLVGLPEQGRERMLAWAAATFNLIGPDLFERDVALLMEGQQFLLGLDRGSVRDGSWAAAAFDAVANGRLSMPEAVSAITAYVVPSLDTTILAKGHLLYTLATNPDQWALLRADPSLVPAAVLEGQRHGSVVRWFSRVAAADYTVEDFTISAGTRVMLLYGCANRDERRYADPDRFDIRRDPRDQLSWGSGPHLCAGLHLAKMEMEVMLEALIEADVTLESETPIMGANRGLYGFTSLPFALNQAAPPAQVSRREARGKDRRHASSSAIRVACQQSSAGGTTLIDKSGGQMPFGAKDD